MAHRCQIGTSWDEPMRIVLDTDEGAGGGGFGPETFQSWAFPELPFLNTQSSSMSRARQSSPKQLAPTLSCGSTGETYHMGSLRNMVNPEPQVVLAASGAWRTARNPGVSVGRGPSEAPSGCITRPCHGFSALGRPLGSPVERVSAPVDGVLAGINERPASVKLYLPARTAQAGRHSVCVPIWIRMLLWLSS